jgi:hypothetical protein
MMVFILMNGLSFADQERDRDKRKYEIIITNLTRGQIFSPPIVIGHNGNFSLFTLGDKASDGLALLAEEGNPEDLIDALNPKFDYEVADGPVLPGASKSIKLEISKRGATNLISVAGMLVTTNDAFFAVRGIWVSGKKKVIVEAPAYDAGSERNSEDCEFIPGPPCNKPGVHDDTADPEGYVHVHAGIHGIDPEGDVSSLNPAEHDWRNPVAKITIHRMY